MDNDVLTRLEKQIEGNGLALAAVAEVLQKMDSRLSKAEDEDEEEKEKIEEAAALEAASMEKAMLVKAIAKEVMSLVKSDAGESPYGMETDGENVRSGDSTASTEGDSNEDDSSETTDVDTDTDSVQGIIEAMQKQLSTLSKEYEEDAAISDIIDDEEDDDDDEEEAGSDMQYMKKTMEKMIKAETEKRLQKMGFKEENSLMSPQVRSLGYDGTTPLSKSTDAGADTVDQLTNLSYKQLRDMQFKAVSGDTDGLPREIIER